MIGLINILLHIFIYRKTTWVVVGLYFAIYIAYIVVSVLQSKKTENVTEEENTIN